MKITMSLLKLLEEYVEDCRLSAMHSYDRLYPDGPASEDPTAESTPERRGARLELYFLNGKHDGVKELLGMIHKYSQKEQSWAHQLSTALKRRFTSLTSKKNPCSHKSI